MKMIQKIMDENGMASEQFSDSVEQCKLIYMVEI